MRIVCLSGPKTSGKDTAARGLFDLNDREPNQSYHFRKAQLAEGVKNVCREFFGYTQEQMEDGVLKETPTDTWPFLAPRWPLMDIANWLRDYYGPNIHIHRWERVAQEAEAAWATIIREQLCHVVTDLRFPNELEFFRNQGALICYVERAEAEEALAKKMAEGDPMALNPSEAHYALIKGAADVILKNDSTIAHLELQLLAAVKNKFGYWGHWGRGKAEE